jgi:putative tricarboxylic transport membrane protein
VRLNDAVAGLACLVLGVAIVVQARAFPAIPGQRFGAALFPTLIGLGLCGCGVVLVARGLRHWTALPGIRLDDWARSPRHVLRVLLTIGLVVFYILVSPALGFLPAAFAVAVTLMLALGVRPAPALLASAGAAFLIHQIFVTLFRVPLPWGLVPPFSW